MIEREREFEWLIFDIPTQLAKAVDPPFDGLVRFVAERYLMRADNAETLYFSALRAEVAAEVALLKAARDLNAKQIDALIRMTIAGVRARLYSLRGEATQSGSLGNHPSGVNPKSLGFLSSLPPRSWPLLLVLDADQTRLLLHCLAGVHESVPARPRWGRSIKSPATELLSAAS